MLDMFVRAKSGYFPLGKWSEEPDEEKQIVVFVNFSLAVPSGELMNLWGC